MHADTNGGHLVAAGTRITLAANAITVPQTKNVFTKFLIVCLRLIESCGPLNAVITKASGCVTRRKRNNTRNASNAVPMYGFQINQVGFFVGVPTTPMLVSTLTCGNATERRRRCWQTVHGTGARLLQQGEFRTRNVGCNDMLNLSLIHI